MIDQITQIMSGIKELELELHRLKNALEMMNRAYEAAYQKGYSDAMGWKTQNHLEHLPPTPCKTCEALARTVMMDQTSHDIRKEWVGLTLEEVMEITGVKPTDSDWNVTIAHKWIRAIEDKLKEKNYG